MTTIDSTVFGVASTGGGGGSGVVKYKPGIIATPGDEIRSMKDYDVYLRWSKEPEALQLSKDPADDPDNFLTTNALAPVGGYAYINNENPNLLGDFAIIDKGLIRNRGCLYSTDTTNFAELPEDSNFPPISKDFIFKLPVNTYQISSNQTEKFDILTGDYNDEGDLYFLSNATAAVSGLTGIVRNGIYKMTKEGVITRITPAAMDLGNLYNSIALVHLGGSDWLLTDCYNVGFYPVSRLSTNNCQTWTALTSGSYYNIVQALDLVVTTSGRIFITSYNSVSTSVGTNLFYEFVIDKTTLKWTTVPVTMPNSIPTISLSAFVNIVAIPGNKLFVCHGNENNYIYDVDTGIFQVVSSATTGTSAYYTSSLSISNWHAYNPDDNCVYRGIAPVEKNLLTYAVINLSDNKVRKITSIDTDYFWCTARMVVTKGGGVLTYALGLYAQPYSINYDSRVDLTSCLAYSDYLTTSDKNEAKRDRYTMQLSTAISLTSRYTHKPFLFLKPVVVGYRYDKINVIWDYYYLMSIKSKPFIKPLAHTQVSMYSTYSSTVQLTQSKRIF